MQTENTQIETIERYLLGGMTAEERIAFSGRLAGDEVLQEETSDLEQIFGGFRVLREEQLQANFAEWDKENRDEDELMLIEAFLISELSAENRNMVLERLETDQDFGEKMNQHKTLLAGFEAIRSEEFEDRLKTWENKPETAKIRKMPPMKTWVFRLGAAASVLLLAGVGLHWYAADHFSASALETAFYQMPNLGGTMRGDTQITDPLVIAYEKAHRQMAAKEFSGAESAFQNVLSLLDMTNLDELTQKNYRDNAEWNILLAQLGLGETGEKFQEQLDAVARDPAHTYNRQAVQLKDKMSGIWYRWVN